MCGGAVTLRDHPVGVCPGAYVYRVAGPGRLESFSDRAPWTTERAGASVRAADGNVPPSG
jgi:hypothetical protein